MRVAGGHAAQAAPVGYRMGHDQAHSVNTAVVDTNILARGLDGSGGRRHSKVKPCPGLPQSSLKIALPSA